MSIVTITRTSDRCSSSTMLLLACMNVHTLKAYMCVFPQNVAGPLEIMSLQLRIVQAECGVVAAVKEFNKTLDDVCWMLFTDAPLHEDKRNIDIVEELSSSLIRENVDLVTFDVDHHQCCLGSHQRQKIIQKDGFCR